MAAALCERVAVRIVLAFLTGALCLTARAWTAEPDGIRILALPLNDRTSLVIELTHLVAEVAEEPRDDPAVIVVEAGPVEAGILAQDLVPDQTLPSIAGVSVRAHQRPGGEIFVRVQVQLGTPAHHTIRSTGQRIYVDLVPVPSVSQASKPTLSTPATPSDRVAARGDDPVRDAAPESVDGAYRTLESDARVRGEKLAGLADVKGLLSLVEEVRRRDQQLGAAQPAALKRILEEANRELEAARKLRLKLDAEALRK